MRAPAAKTAGGLPPDSGNAPAMAPPATADNDTPGNTEFQLRLDKHRAFDSPPPVLSFIRHIRDPHRRPSA